MKLSEADAQLFFHLMLQLQWYVCRKAQIFPKLKTFKSYQDSSMEDKVEVRNYLFGHLELIDQFAQENPAKLAPDELDIVVGWKNCISGNFFIERRLKKYSIFIDHQDNVYGVLGLSDSLENRIDKPVLPRRVKAILLPFKDKIVYDGFLGWYNIYFGSGIKSSLKQTYLIAKDNNAIIESLSRQPKTTKQPKTKSLAKPEWSSLLDELAEKTSKLRGGSGQPATYSPVFSLVRSSIELAQLATEKSPNAHQMQKKVARIEGLIRQLETVIWRLK